MILPVLLFPLLGFVLNLCLWKSANKKLSGAIGAGTVGLVFLFVVGQILQKGFESQTFSLGSWLKVGDMALNFSFIIDPLSLLMCLLITGVAFLIHIYSLGYMQKDPAFARYFAYLNLFVFFQLILVLAGNLPLLFVGWEGVGLCSYLLIGFWIQEEKKVQAGMLAFVVNRIADACFLLGIFCLFSQLGTVEFFEIQQKEDIPLSVLGPFLLFLGAIGKSAQIPFYFWLPRAMAGPTPVSALIHAATMVTAGVYLLVRMSGLYSLFPNLLHIIAWLGAFTALGSALIATRKWDLKAVLAYSTISQLAYLFIAIGVKAFSASIFHLLTHGFFKALLFLCAGSVIHALKGEQDIRFMGKLKKTMPITFVCYLMGALALIAMPPFSGFFSKDEILWSLFSSGNYSLFFMAFLTGLITVFYMTRLTVLVFFGYNRSLVVPHESGALMKFPMIALAILSVFGGAMGIPHLLSEWLPGHPPHILHELLKNFSSLDFTGSKWLEALLMFLSTTTGLTVMVAVAMFYLQKAKGKPANYFWMRWLEEGFYVDHGIQKYALPFFKQGAFQIYKRLEKGGFHQGVFFLTNQILLVRNVLSRLQSGNLQSYAFYFTMGLTVLMFLIFLR